MTQLSEQIITLLFVHGDPMYIKNIAEILEVTEGETVNSLKDIEAKLAGTPISFIQQNNQLVLTTKTEYASTVQKLREYETISPLTPAQLQTLTIVAYMGPVNNANVSFVRGVQSAQTLRALNTRGLVTKTDTEYNISIESMKYLGINKLQDLPMYDETREKLQAKINEALNG